MVSDGANISQRILLIFFKTQAQSVNFYQATHVNMNEKCSGYGTIPVTICSDANNFMTDTIKRHSANQYYGTER